jgi:hypothetical protein
VEITVDGRFAGKSPNARLAGLKIGRVYQVVATRAGFKPFEGTVTSEGTKEEIEYSMELERLLPAATAEKAGGKRSRESSARGTSKAKGKLACGTRPQGAEIWVDGKNSGRQTPVPISNPLFLSAGQHTVVFKLNGKQSGPHQVSIPDGENPVLLNHISIE